MRTLWTILTLAVVAAVGYFLVSLWGWMPVVGVLCFAAAAVLGLALLAWAFPPVGWYVAYFLAKYDLIFTKVPSPYFKVAVRFGEVRRILMSKIGHKVEPNPEGDITPLAPGEPPESPLPGGLRLLGWPGIDTVYTKEMKFLKSMPDGTIKPYDVPDVSMFYAKVDYPYAVPFVKCEDKNNLPISGHCTLIASVSNPKKALFDTANFYDTMVGLALPVIRRCFEKFTFDEIKEKEDLDGMMWDALNSPRHDNPRSVYQELRDDYGVTVVALRTVAIDPPEEFRKTTLIKWTAEREADAARAVARKQAEETEGRVIEAVARANGLSREELEEVLANNPEIKGLPAEQGGFKEDFAHARDVLKRDRAGDGLEDIRVGNVDGTPLEPVTGVIAAMFGLKQRQSRRRKNNGGNPSGNPGGQGQQKKRVKDMAPEEREKLLRELGIKK